MAQFMQSSSKPVIFTVTVFLLCQIISCRADSNCFVSNCERDDDPCQELPDKNVAIYKESCRIGRWRKGTVAICCRPNSDEGMLMTAYGAERHEFPHMVQVRDNCAGTLYNRKFVITSAHCVTQPKFATIEKDNKTLTFDYEDPVEFEEVFVTIGSNIKSAGHKIRAEKVSIHPFYSGLLENLKTDEDKLGHDRAILYDIAIIKLEKDVEVSEHVRTLKIAGKGFMPSKYSKRAVILGWGDDKTWLGNLYLQKVTAAIRSERECALWETEPYPKHKNKLICIGENGNEDFAPLGGPGSSGDPLVCKDAQSRAVLCGVGSNACGSRLRNGRCYPNAFTSIAHFHDWIESIAGYQDEKDLYRPVLNGDTAKPSNFPHVVYINSTDGMSCGGTLITQDVVLTAAHCILDEKATFRVDLTVYAGLQYHDHDGDHEDDGHVQVFLVDRIHGPPKFRKKWDKWMSEEDNPSSVVIADRPYFQEDIILVQLDQPIEETKYVHPVNWALDENEITDDALEISWKISRSGKPFIQKRKFQVLKHEQCQQRLDRLRPVKSLPLGQMSFCAVEDYSGGSACDRTTGGPMICSSKRENYLCGIQSFRFCAYAFPNVITNVGKYAEWIEEGLERFDRQRHYDELHGNGYDYDYYAGGINNIPGKKKKESGEEPRTKLREGHRRHPPRKFSYLNDDETIRKGEEAAPFRKRVPQKFSEYEYEY